MRFIVSCAVAALTVSLLALASSNASAQSTAAKRQAQAQNPTSNTQTVNDCIQLAMQRGYSVSETQPEYRNAAKQFVLGCLRGKYR